MGQALLFITMGLSVPGDASGPIDICLRPHVTSDAEPVSPWLEALHDACADLDTSDAVDQRALVRVYVLQPDVVLVVTTADGREAARRVRNPKDLRDTLEALIVLPATREPSAPPAAPATPRPAVPEETSVEVAIEPRLSTEVGVGMGGRVATHGRLALGPAAFVNLHLQRWLAGVSLRWDALQNAGDNTIPQYEAQAVAFGLSIGRRVHDDAVTVDCAIEPRVVATAQSNGEGAQERRTTTSDVFVGALTRVALGQGGLRPFVQLDAELAPLGIDRVANEGALYTPLPSWSVGVTAGLRWVVE